MYNVMTPGNIIYVEPRVPQAELQSYISLGTGFKLIVYITTVRTPDNNN